jgi:hypothetical protein
LSRLPFSSLSHTLSSAITCGCSMMA